MGLLAARQNFAQGVQADDADRAVGEVDADRPYCGPVDRDAFGGASAARLLLVADDLDGSLLDEAREHGGDRRAAQAGRLGDAGAGQRPAVAEGIDDLGLARVGGSRQRPRRGHAPTLGAANSSISPVQNHQQDEMQVTPHSDRSSPSPRTARPNPEIGARTPRTARPQPHRKVTCGRQNAF
jgi:hypothetical protein